MTVPPPRIRLMVRPHASWHRRARRTARRVAELLGFALMAACMIVGAATIGATLFVWFVWR